MTASCSPAGKRLMGIKNVRLVSFTVPNASPLMLTASIPSVIQPLLSKYAAWPSAKPGFQHVCCSQCILGSHTAEPEQLPPERRLQQCPPGPQPVWGDAMFWTILDGPGPPHAQGLPREEARLPGSRHQAPLGPIVAIPPRHKGFGRQAPPGFNVKKEQCCRL